MNLAEVFNLMSCTDILSVVITRDPHQYGPQDLVDCKARSNYINIKPVRGVGTELKLRGHQHANMASEAEKFACCHAPFTLFRFPVQSVSGLS